MLTDEKRYWGFALVEFEEMKDGETQAQKLKAFRQLQAEIKKDPNNVTSSFGREVIRWPPRARIEEVHAIKRLYGFPKVTEFNLYIRVTAKNSVELAQAFRFLDRHCHVEGYM